jgi:hypothetical protein
VHALSDTAEATIAPAAVPEALTEALAAPPAPAAPEIPTISLPAGELQLHGNCQQQAAAAVQHHSNRSWNRLHACMQVSCEESQHSLLHVCFCFADTCSNTHAAGNRPGNHRNGPVQSKNSTHALLQLFCVNALVAQAGIKLPVSGFAELPPLPDLGAASEQAAKTVSGLTDGVSSAAAGALPTAAAAATAATTN